MENGDGAIWPMQISEGGTPFSFCPGKATWDPQNASLFKLLTISAETGQMLYDGGISNQPDWYIELFAWFLPRFDTMKFLAKADMILGGSKKSAPSNMPGPKRMNHK